MLALVWVLLLVPIIGLWLAAFAPTKFWINLVIRERIAITVAALVAIVAWGIALLAQDLWGALGALGELTFDASAWLLGLVYSDVVADPQNHVLDTSKFLVSIASVCPGYEGIGLVVVFNSFFLSMFRRDFGFPQALLLFPVGIVTIWSFNALRIAVLIMIGDEFSPEVAVGGFHTQAGWISFVLVAVGLMAMAYRVSYFSSSQIQEADRPRIPCSG